MTLLTAGELVQVGISGDDYFYDQNANNWHFKCLISFIYTQRVIFGNDGTPESDHFKWLLRKATQANRLLKRLLHCVILGRNIGVRKSLDLYRHSDEAIGDLGMSMLILSPIFYAFLISNMSPDLGLIIGIKLMIAVNTSQTNDGGLSQKCPIFEFWWAKNRQTNILFKIYGFLAISVQHQCKAVQAIRTIKSTNLMELSFQTFVINKILRFSNGKLKAVNKHIELMIYKIYFLFTFPLHIMLRHNKFWWFFEIKIKNRF